MSICLIVGHLLLSEQGEKCYPFGQPYLPSCQRHRANLRCSIIVLLGWLWDTKLKVESQTFPHNAATGLVLASHARLLIDIHNVLDLFLAQENDIRGPLEPMGFTLADGIPTFSFKKVNYMLELPKSADLPRTEQPHSAVAPPNSHQFNHKSLTNGMNCRGNHQGEKSRIARDLQSRVYPGTSPSLRFPETSGKREKIRKPRTQSFCPASQVQKGMSSGHGTPQVQVNHTHSATALPWIGQNSSCSFATNTSLPKSSKFMNSGSEPHGSANLKNPTTRKNPTFPQKLYQKHPG